GRGAAPARGGPRRGARADRPPARAAALATARARAGARRPPCCSPRRAGAGAGGRRRSRRRLPAGARAPARSGGDRPARPAGAGRRDPAPGSAPARRRARGGRAVIRPRRLGWATPRSRRGLLWIALGLLLAAGAAAATLRISGRPGPVSAVLVARVPIPAGTL